MDLRQWSAFSLLDNEVIDKIKFACVFGLGGKEVALFVTDNDELWGFGSNMNGCLAMPRGPGFLEPKLVEYFKNKRTRALSFGHNHIVVVTEKGEVYSWGSNDSGELGRVATTADDFIPGIVCNVLTGVKITDVACGHKHTLVLSDVGEVYSWGMNRFGETGSGVKSKQSAPKKVSGYLCGKFVAKIACGHISSVAVTANGDVFTWGYNASGQLGIDELCIGNLEAQSLPVRVNALAGNVISDLVCGHSHVLAVTDEGILYGWGLNCNGQLGTGDTINRTSPTQVASHIGRVIDVAASYRSNISAAMNHSSNVFMWGACQDVHIPEPLLTRYTSLHDVFAHCSKPAVSYKPIKPITCTNNVASTMEKAFDNLGCSDLTIMVEGKPIHVHKSILKIRCQYFRNMLKEPWKENSEGILTVDTKTYTVYRAFLQYLYTDKVFISPQDALELLELAAEYCEDRLKRKCEEIIRHSITVENAASLYSAAITMNATELESFCVSFSLNHMTAVIQTPGFSKLDHQVMKRFIIDAAKRGAFRS